MLTISFYDFIVLKNSLKGYFSDKDGWKLVVDDQVNLIKETKKIYPKYYNPEHFVKLGKKKI